jgi:hypothetical protein
VESINYTDLKKKKKNLFSEQWRQNSGGMPPLFKKKTLFSEQWTQFGRAESSKLLLSISLRLARNKLGDPCTVNNFFS